MSGKTCLSKNSVARAVGWYDLLVGLWPLVAPDSFKSAAKSDQTLPIARLIGTMWATLGAALLLSSSNRKVIPLLGVASTIAGSALAAAECSLVFRKKLPATFLLQAAAETAIGVAWMISLTSDREDNEEKTERE